MDDAYPHLLLVLLRPVRRPGQRGRDRRDQPGRDQPPGRLLVAAGEIEDASRQPGPDRGLDQHRVQRVPEPAPVQRVAHSARFDQPGYALTHGYDAVET